MVTEAISAPRTPAPDVGHALLDRWRRPRIAAASLDDGCAAEAPRARRTGRWKVEPERHDDRLIAVAARWKGDCIGRASLEVRGSQSVIRSFRVDDAWRGRGVGRRLLRALVQRARLQGVRTIFVLATAADAGFYALNGFRPAPAPSGASLPFDAAPDEDVYTIMSRPLSSGLVHVPLDGVIVHF